MGNEDGFMSAATNMGTNTVVKFEGGYFSFAFGNEIAFCIDGNYYILNCTSKLFDEVKEQVEKGLSKTELKKFWFKKSKDYEVSDWSAEFSDLE